MHKIDPHFVYDENNKKTGIILTLKDFERCIDTLGDYHDHISILERRKEKGPFIPFEDVIKKLKKKNKK